MSTTALDTLTGKHPTLVRIEHQIAHLLPQAPLRARFAAVLFQQIRLSPALQKCTPASLMAAVVRMAQLQLDPAIPNECWLVPYKTEATFIVGYGGLRKLALRSPEVQDILVDAVHERDTYLSPQTLGAPPTHIRPPGFGPRGKVIGYYAAALLQTEHYRVLEMSKEEVKAHRDRYSRSAQATFWNEGRPDEVGLSNFDKMALKTVLRQLCSPRHLSLSAEVQMALVQEEALYAAPPAARVTANLAPPRAGNGHTAANALFGHDTGLQGVAQEAEFTEETEPTIPDFATQQPQEGPEESDVDHEPPEEEKSSTEGPEPPSLEQITNALPPIWDEKAIRAFWRVRCEHYLVPAPAQLSADARRELWEEAKRITAKQTGKPGGRTFLAQIDAAWQAQGLDAAQIDRAWTATCVRYGVVHPSQLKMSVLPGLLEQARRGTLVEEMQAPQDGEQSEAALEDGDIPF